MNCLYATPDNNRLAAHHGRKILLLRKNPLPDDLQVNLHAINLAVSEDATESEIQAHYAQVEWEPIVKYLRENDVFIVRSVHGHLSTLTEHLTALGIGLIPLKERKRKRRNYKYSSWEKDQWKGALGYALDEEPLTPPVIDGKPVPFIRAGGDLVIPFKSDKRYQWWKGGMSLTELVHRFEGRVPVDVYRNLLTHYARHE